MNLPAPPSRARPVRRLFRRDESGAALVEFALVAVLFFFILYALIVFGMTLALKQSVTNAAAEGARSAVGSADPSATALSTVQQRLSWLSADQRAALTVDRTVAPCSGGSGQCITVRVSYPYGSKPLVPPAPIVSGITPSVIGSTATVQIS